MKQEEENKEAYYIKLQMTQLRKHIHNERYMRDKEKEKEMSYPMIFSLNIFFFCQN